MAVLVLNQGLFLRRVRKTIAGKNTQKRIEEIKSTVRMNKEIKRRKNYYLIFTDVDKGV